MSLSPIERSSKVRVGVRVRPLGSKELQQGGKTSISVTPPSIKVGQKYFTYDAVFGSSTDQEDLYTSVSSSLLDSFVEGYNATILAYGQTGSGKTYTMGSEAHTQPEGSPQVGLIPRFISDFFRLVQEKKEKSDSASAKFDDGGTNGGSALLGYSMKASFLEVYGEDVYDLLDSERKSLPLRDDAGGGVVIAGLTTRTISNPSEALHVLHEGTNNRTTAATLMNLTSSRSHAVFTIQLSQITESSGDQQLDVVSTSKFTFVDLAGSERMKKTGAEGERAREGIKINEGLLALGNVINALADEERMAKEKKIHVPYRQSKLTRLLQDALGGNSQTLFLACVSPSDTNVSETLSTLHYANRARNIRNAPTKNLDATTTELQRLHTLTRILQCELVKSRFRAIADDDEKENIGEVEDSLMKRDDVEKFLRLVHGIANELSGAETAPEYSFQPMVTALSIKSDGKSKPSISSVEATPSKGLSERFDDSFLVDVNPDEDLAILDHLLELQHADHEYDKAKKHDDAQLKRMDGELVKEEAMLLQLRESLKVYHSLKKKYEELMAEVQQLEVEKENLASQLEKTTADPTMGCSAAIKRQLERVELCLSRARRETLTHRQKYKDAEDQAKRCRVLERKIADLKQAKNNLAKKQKETTARYKETSEAKTKELLALRRRERAAETHVSKMRTEIQHHKSNLDKRKHYITKLTDKLKQTESHLVKLLSMRQRDLVERASRVGRSRASLVADPFNTHVEKTEKSKDLSPRTLSSEDQKSMLFILDKMVSEKIEHSHLTSQYEDQVAAYSDTMRLVVFKVKALKERQAEDHMETEATKPRDSIGEIKESVAELELKLELMGTELKEIELQLPDEAKHLRDEEAVQKLMGEMPGSALRTMLFDSFSSLVKAETETRASRESISRKDAALLTFESEVELLNGKVASLTKDLAKRSLLVESGEDLFGLLKNATVEKDDLASNLLVAQTEVAKLKSHLSQLEEAARTQGSELANTKDHLTLAESTLSKFNGSVESKGVMEELHSIWTFLGVDDATREKTRQEIEHCLSDTCRKKLDEAINLQSRVQTEAVLLRSRNVSMQQALCIAGDNVQKGTGLLKETRLLRQQVETLKVPYTNASTRRERIISDMINLSSALGLSKEQLPVNLRTLMGQIEQLNPSKSTIGRLRRASIMQGVQVMVESLSDELQGERDNQEISSTESASLPAGSLKSEFLSSCEKDVSELRVRKSEVLVKNRENSGEIAHLVKSMHSTANGLVATIELFMKTFSGGLPSWWDKDYVLETVQMVSSSSPRADSKAEETLHLESIREALIAVASCREGLSNVLRSTVEKAQETLLDIVGRELDASEAYASFHDALFKLPSLSKDFTDACISEMEALVLGVETMTQSEIEALTVVWEALKVSSEDRRSFWGDIDDQEYSKKEGGGNPFTCLDSTMEKNVEEWITFHISDGSKVYQELEVKLAKLDAIHKEVEKLRSKQDTKSQILSLDSELRILNSKLLDFEELQCSKQRLLTKKSGSAALLKEERFRKQMKAKFVTKLGQLASLLRLWEGDEGHAFKASMLSEDVRMLLDSPDKMEGWIEKRTKLMPSRTVMSLAPRKRSFEETTQTSESSSETTSKSRSKLRQASGLTPPRKKAAKSRGLTPPRTRIASNTIKTPPKTKPATITSTQIQRAAKTAARLKSSASSTTRSTSSPARKRKAKPDLSENVDDNTQSSRSKLPSRSRDIKTRRKEPASLPPFGRILLELVSPSKPPPKGDR